MKGGSKFRKQKIIAIERKAVGETPDCPHSYLYTKFFPSRPILTHSLLSNACPRASNPQTLSAAAQRGPFQRRSQASLGPFRRRDPRSLEKDPKVARNLRHRRGSRQGLRHRSQNAPRSQGQNQLHLRCCSPGARCPWVPGPSPWPTRQTGRVLGSAFVFHYGSSFRSAGEVGVQGLQVGEHCGFCGYQGGG